MVQVRESKIAFPENSGLVQLPEFSWASAKEWSDVRHLYNAGQDFEVLTPAVDDKERTHLWTDYGLRFDFECICSRTNTMFAIYSSRSPSPTEENHCENSSTRWQRSYRVLINTKFTRTKDSRPLPGSPIPVTNIDGTRNRTGDITANMQVLLSIMGKEGHIRNNHLYLADLGKKILS